MGRFILAIFIIFIFVKRADLLAKLGHFHFHRGNTPKAIRVFKVADKIGKLSVNNRIAYGYLLLRQGAVDEAAKILTFVSMYAQKSAVKNRVKSILAIVRWRQGEIDEAIESLEELIENYKTSSAYQSLGLLYLIKRDAERALKLNLEAYEYSNSDRIILDNLAQSYALNNDFEKAKEAYEKLFELEPHFPEAFFGYGKLLIELGERERGIDLVQQALDKPFMFLSVITREEVEEYLQQISLPS